MTPPARWPRRSRPSSPSATTRRRSARTRCSGTAGRSGAASPRSSMRSTSGVPTRPPRLANAASRASPSPGLRRPRWDEVAVRILTAGSMYPPQHLGGYELIWQDAVRLLRARGHTVRVLASDLALPGRDQEPEADADVHRQLRRYWERDRSPRLSPRARLLLERANAATFDRHVDEFRPAAVCWFNMGGLSLSLLERARRVGLPAVAYVADDWLVDGPRLDGWSRAFAARPWTARAVGRLTGI